MEKAREPRVSGELAQPRLSIIIPTLQPKRTRNPKYLLARRYTLGEVLRDLDKHVHVHFEVIVICNGVEPEFRQFVQQNARIDKYAINSVNVGVSRAWNMGAMLATGEILCFLNDDVEVGDSALDRLCDVLRDDPAIGVTGPRGSLWKGTEHDRYVGEAEPEDADNISGFCFLVRSDVFHRLGGFDVAYTPAGFEEIDFCLAVRRAGLRCRVVPGLPIVHHERHGVSTSTGTVQYLGTSIDTKSLHLRNKAHFKRKWHIPD